MGFREAFKKKLIWLCWVLAAAHCLSVVKTLLPMPGTRVRFLVKKVDPKVRHF